MLIDVAGRDVLVRCRYTAPLPHSKEQFHPDQYVLAPASAKADRSNVASNISTMYHSTCIWYPVRDLNPCYRRERAAS